MATVEHLPIAIVGAGFSGIGLAARLLGAGFTDVTLLERADDVGGVWRDNTYPGCACDVPSALYSYSFAPNPDWTRLYATQPEILSYLRRVAREHDVTPRVRFGCELLDASWDDAERRWRLDTSTGPLTASVLISSMGLFGAPIVPDLPGLSTFTGTMFHSLHWDHQHDLTGERVAVIGTGASAAQFVPAIAPSVGQLLVFQRTPPWVMPRLDLPRLPLQSALFRAFPPAQRALRGGVFAAIESLGLVAFVDTRLRHPFEAIGRLQLRRQVRDPQLRERLTPDYVIGCKRAILTDAYLPALARENVEVVTEAITEVRPGSILTGDGREHAVDTIILGTGFEAPSRMTARIRGRDGRSITALHDERPRSYLGTSFAGFPNFFMTLGPFGAAGNQSAIYMMEAQFAHVLAALRHMRDAAIAVVEVRPQEQEAFTSAVEARSAGTAWEDGGCRSYYQTPDGRNAGLWPAWSVTYARRARRFDPHAYVLTPSAERTGALTP